MTRPRYTVKSYSAGIVGMRHRVYDNVTDLYLGKNCSTFTQAQALADARNDRLNEEQE